MKQSSELIGIEPGIARARTILRRFVHRKKLIAVLQDDM